MCLSCSCPPFSSTSLHTKSLGNPLPAVSGTSIPADRSQGRGGRGGLSVNGGRGPHNPIEKARGHRCGLGSRAAAPQAEQSHPLSPSPGHPVRAPAGGCRGRPSHRRHYPGHHHLLLHEETAKTVIPCSPGERKEPQPRLLSPGLPPSPEVSCPSPPHLGEEQASGLCPQRTPHNLSSSSRCRLSSSPAPRPPMVAWLPSPSVPLSLIYLTSPTQSGGHGPHPPLLPSRLLPLAFCS